jgi:hypothetical protein
MYVDASMWILFDDALCLFKQLACIVRNCRVVPMISVVLGFGEETE